MELAVGLQLVYRRLGDAGGGGAGNNLGAVLGTVVVWGCWVASGFLLASFAPAQVQIYAGTLQYLLIGLTIVVMLLARPRGLVPERLEIWAQAASSKSGIFSRAGRKLQS